jgi:hypothetical protein
MTEEEVQKILEEEIDLHFIIQTYKVVIKKPIGPTDEYRTIYVIIKQPKDTEIVRHEQILTGFTINSLLKDIKELYRIYKYSQNQKLTEGAKEEILKAIAFLLWTLW